MWRQEVVGCSLLLHIDSVLFAHSGGESLIEAVLQISLNGYTVALAWELSLQSALIPFPAGFEEVSVHGQVPLEGEAGLCLCL